MTDVPVAARPATVRDLDRLGELYLEHGRACEAVDPAYQRAVDAGRPWRAALVKGLKEDHLRVPVTMADGRQIVSFLVALVAPAPMGSAVPWVGFFQEFFVEPEYRRQGRLRAMHADALRWFQVKRAPRVELLADLRDEGTLAAWRRLGYNQVQAVLRGIVPPE